MRVHVVNPQDRDYVCAVVGKVMGTYDGRGIEWKHPVDDPELWKLNSGQRAGVVGVELNGRRCCAKLFYDDRIQAKLRNLLGLSKAKRAFKNALRLKGHGIGCPEMIGWSGIRAAGPFVVVSELCDHAWRTDHYIAEHGINRRIVLDFAAFVRKLHGEGIGHIDFSLRNTMVVDGADGGYRFLLLDFEDARFHATLSRRQRLDNLHHLLERVLKSVPLKWRIRFLKEYLQTDEIREWVDALGEMLQARPSKYAAHLASPLRR